MYFAPGLWSLLASSAGLGLGQELRQPLPGRKHVQLHRACQSLAMSGLACGSKPRLEDDCGNSCMSREGLKSSCPCLAVHAAVRVSNRISAGLPAHQRPIGWVCDLRCYNGIQDLFCKSPRCRLGSTILTRLMGTPVHALGG